jgi:hypothetical protein
MTLDPWDKCPFRVSREAGLSRFRHWDPGIPEALDFAIGDGEMYAIGPTSDRSLSAVFVLGLLRGGNDPCRHWVTYPGDNRRHREDGCINVSARTGTALDVLSVRAVLGLSGDFCHWGCSGAAPTVRVLFGNHHRGRLNSQPSSNLGRACCSERRETPEHGSGV